MARTTIASLQAQLAAAHTELAAARADAQLWHDRMQTILDAQTPAPVAAAPAKPAFVRRAPQPLPDHMVKARELAMRIGKSVAC